MVSKKIQENRLQAGLEWIQAWNAVGEIIEISNKDMQKLDKKLTKSIGPKPPKNMATTDKFYELASDSIALLVLAVMMTGSLRRWQLEIERWDDDDYLSDEIILTTNQIQMDVNHTLEIYLSPLTKYFGSGSQPMQSYVISRIEEEYNLDQELIDRLKPVKDAFKKV